MKFLLEIITPQRQAFSQEVDSASVPTSTGYIGVLPRHEPLFCSLTEGEIKISISAKEYFLAIGGGFMEVTPKKVTILVSRAAHAGELNEAEIKKAHTAAKDAIANRAKGADLAAAQAILRRSVLELKIIRRNRPHHMSLNEMES